MPSSGRHLYTDRNCFFDKVHLSRDDQHGHADCPDHEPRPEARPGRQGLALPGGLKDQPAIRQVR